MVTKNVPAYSIAGGNPAKVLKYRFDEETIQKLAELKWWNWEENRIRENVSLLSSNSISEFLINN